MVDGLGDEEDAEGDGDPAEGKMPAATIDKDGKRDGEDETGGGGDLVEDAAGLKAGKEG